jgi:hypothetical protein
VAWVFAPLFRTKILKNENEEFEKFYSNGFCRDRITVIVGRVRMKRSSTTRNGSRTGMMFLLTITTVRCRSGIRSSGRADEIEIGIPVMMSADFLGNIYPAH